MIPKRNLSWHQKSPSQGVVFPPPTIFWRFSTKNLMVSLRGARWARHHLPRGWFRSMLRALQNWFPLVPWHHGKPVLIDKGGGGSDFPTTKIRGPSPRKKPKLEPPKLVICRCFFFSKQVCSGSILVFDNVYTYLGCVFVGWLFDFCTMVK